jgi:hypothetical protein
VVKKVCLKITPHFKFAVQYSTVQYSTVQYSTIRYSISTVQYCYYRYLYKKLKLNKFISFYLKICNWTKFISFYLRNFQLKNRLNKNSIKSSTIENNTCENMIWLAWERVYFRLKIFLFRNSFLWNVKKEEFVLTEQRRIFDTSERRSYWRPELPSVSLLEVYWKKWSLLKQWRAERLLKILFFIQF